MKIRTHFVFGKRNTVACGTHSGFVTHNVGEITCKRCLRTAALKSRANPPGKAVICNAKGQVIGLQG